MLGRQGGEFQPPRRGEVRDARPSRVQCAMTDLELLDLLFWEAVSVTIPTSRYAHGEPGEQEVTA